MPTTDRKPRRRRVKPDELVFGSEAAARAACDAARALPEPEREERLRTLRPALRKHVRQTWLAIPRIDTETWVDGVIESYYIAGRWRASLPPPEVDE
jgi:hypothetical protein